MRNLMDRFRAEFSPMKLIMLLVCAAILVAVLVFIGTQVAKLGGDESVSAGKMLFDSARLSMANVAEVSV